MKRNQVIVGILAVAALSFGSIVAGQVLGGYRAIEKDDERGVAAAEFAVKEESTKKEMTYKLINIEHAEAQVVAGTNFRLCLKIGYHKQDDDVDTTEFVRVIVYQNLQKEFSLTSWTEENCGDDSGLNR